jgi:hypothetical protein
VPGLDLSPLSGKSELTVFIDSGQDVRNADALGLQLMVN